MRPRIDSRPPDPLSNAANPRPELTPREIILLGLVELIESWGDDDGGEVDLQNEGGVSHA